MKNVILVLWLSLLLACNAEKTGTGDNDSSVSEAENVKDAVIASYIELKDALVESDAKAARESADDLLAAAQDANLSNESVAIIRKIQSSEDLSEIRNSFDPLSQQIYSWIKNSGANDQKLYWQYCPMAKDNEGASWLSLESEILNPYFGEQMLRCGNVKEEL